MIVNQVSNMDPEISEFEERDRLELRRLYMDVKQDTFKWLGVPVKNGDTFDHDTKGEEILVARIDGQIAGFVSVWLPDNFIHHLYILKKYQRMGLGTCLIKSLRAKLKGKLTLKCVEYNETAVNFYRKNGWKVKSRGISEHGVYILFELD